MVSRTLPGFGEILLEMEVPPDQPATPLCQHIDCSPRGGSPSRLQTTAPWSFRYPKQLPCHAVTFHILLFVLLLLLLLLLLIFLLLLFSSSFRCSSSLFSCSVCFSSSSFASHPHNLPLLLVFLEERRLRVIKRPPHLGTLQEVVF